MGSTPQPAPLAPKDDSDRGDGTTTSDARLDVVLEALRENADRQAFLLRLSDALRPLADAHEIQATASRLLGEHLRANRVCYGETTDTEVIVRRDYVDGVPSMVGRYPKDSFGRVMTDRLRRGETLVVDDMDRLPGLLDSERQVTRAIHVAAHIAVTLIKDGQWVANLAVHSATPRHWTPAEVALAEDVADRTWAAAERARERVEAGNNAARQATVDDDLRPATRAGAKYDVVTTVAVDVAGCDVDAAGEVRDGAGAAGTGVAALPGRRRSKAEERGERAGDRLARGAAVNADLRQRARPGGDDDVVLAVAIDVAGRHAMSLARACDNPDNLSECGLPTPRASSRR